MLWSAALHAAAFLALARFAPPRVTPAEVRFEVRVASVAYDAVEPPAPDDPRATEPVPADAPPPEAAPWTAPADETPLPDVDAEVVPLDDVEAAPPPTVGPVGPSSPIVATRRPTPRPPAAPAASPLPPTPAAPPPVAVAVAAPAAAPAVASSAVESARPDAGNAPPVYPAQARAQRQTGVVTLRIDVDEAGAVRAVAVAASSGHASLDASAVEAARGWRFSPARRAGVPIASAVLRRVRFVLDPS